MASLSRQYSKEKLSGQVFTPPFIVAKILDDVGYSGPAIVGKTILDPACGDGRFLEAIVQRILEQAAPEQRMTCLAAVYGWDIDPIAIADCTQRLDALTAPFGLSVNWNIFVADALMQAPQQPFDFIVGNPPYIRIQHLEAAQRQHIQTQFDFCKSGSTDIYIAFIELSLRLLAQSGTLGLIVPNSVLFTETTKALRQHLIAQQHLVSVTNYGDIQLFEGATTYCAILILNKQKNRQFRLHKAQSINAFEAQTIDIEAINTAPWRLAAPLDDAQQQGQKLGDIAAIHVGITTLCDKAYLMRLAEEHGDNMLVFNALRGTIWIEKAILRPIIKASKLRSQPDQQGEYILFPYQLHGGKNQLIPAATMETQYPLAYAHLLSVRTELDQRDAGSPNPVGWYAYGRSQGLETSFGAKILFSPMSDKPHFVYIEDTQSTFYSGYCIKYPGDIIALLAQLNSDRMAEFIDTHARDFRGGWKAYNKRVVEQFRIL